MELIPAGANSVVQMYDANLVLEVGNHDVSLCKTRANIVM